VAADFDFKSNIWWFWWIY